MIDHFTKFAYATPYKEYIAKEVCRLITEHWIAPYGAPIVVQSDKGPLFTAQVTKEFLKFNDITQFFSTRYHPQMKDSLKSQTEPQSE